MKTAILGAGSWGIALANHCDRLGHETILWEFDPQMAAKLAAERERVSALPGIRISSSVRITSDLQESIERANLILLVIPSHFVRSVLVALAKGRIPDDAILVSCTKGIENDTLMRISEVVQDEIPTFDFNHFAALSGPSHAEEVSRQIPTAVVVAAKSEPVAISVQNALNSPTFRLYRSPDVVGVELGGSLKNVIAIAAGICDGAGFGDNTKAALQPRGLAEIARLGRKLNADPMTFGGLSGMGDLIVTCMSRHSRNRYVGEQIGKGRRLDDILREMTMVAEGVRTCKSAVALAKKYNVEMPICSAVYQVLFEGKAPREALSDLMNRDVKPEVWH